jgi:hypothetical protein
MVYYDIDIFVEDQCVAEIRSIESQRACDQIMGWMRQGLNVNLRLAPDEDAIVV